jgi:hypothetical protein
MYGALGDCKISVIDGGAYSHAGKTPYALGHFPRP